jgi:hypothetical protein
VGQPSPHRDLHVRRDCVTLIDPVAVMTCTLAASPARQQGVLHRQPARIVVGYFAAVQAYDLIYPSGSDNPGLRGGVAVAAASRVLATEKKRCLAASHEHSGSWSAGLAR